MVIGVTDEELSVVDSWVASRKPTYPIAVLSSGAFEDALGVKGFPTVGIVGPEGKLLYKGFKRPSMEGILADAMASATAGEVFPKKKLAKAFKLVMAGEDSKAYAETVKLLRKAEGETAEWLTKYSEYFEGRAQAAHDLAVQLAKEGLLLRAVNLLEPFAKAKPPFPSSEESAKWLASLKDSYPAYKEEMKAGDLFERAAEFVDEGEYTDATKGFVKVYNKYPDTKIAEVARIQAKGLVERGRPGYRSSCTKCRSARRACTKHAETVKL